MQEIGSLYNINKPSNFRAVYLISLSSYICLSMPFSQSLFPIREVREVISLAGGLGFKSNHHHHLLCVCCVCVENAAGVAGLKGRVKAAKDKTKDLLKAVNGTMATLNAIPNGMIASLCVCVCVWGAVHAHKCGRKIKTEWINISVWIEVSCSGKLNLTHVSTHRYALGNALRR